LRPASRLATHFQLAPVAALFARLARLPPACTGCRALQLTPQELSPDSHRKLSPPAAPSNSTFSLRRRLFFPALPPIGPPACAGRAIFQLLRWHRLRLAPEPASPGTTDDVPPVCTGCASSAFASGRLPGFPGSLILRFPRLTRLPACTGCRVRRFHRLTNFDSHGILIFSARPAARFRLAPVVLPSGTSSFALPGFHRGSLHWPGL